MVYVIFSCGTENVFKMKKEKNDTVTNQFISGRHVREKNIQGLHLTVHSLTSNQIIKMQ